MKAFALYDKDNLGISDEQLFEALKQSLEGYENIKKVLFLWPFPSFFSFL